MPKFLVRIVALLIFVAGPKPATAYDVCTDDIEAPADTSCVHEYMAETGFSVFSPGGIRNSELPLGSAAIIAALRNGAGHEDQTDHIYA